MRARITAAGLLAAAALTLAGCNTATSTSDASPAPQSGDSVATASTGTPRFTPSTSTSASAVAAPSSAPSTPKVTGTFAKGEKLVWIQAGGHRAPGTLHVAGTGKTPVVLMLHGDASTRDEVGDMYATEAVQLAAKGISSLRIDFAGSGMAEHPERALTYASMVADATAALQWLKAQSWVDPHRIAVLGFSRGGTVGATLIGKNPDVAAFASWSGAIANGTHEDPKNEAVAKKNGHVVIDLGFRTFDYSYAWFTSIAASHALDDVLGYRNPVLVVYGTADTDVSPALQLNFAAKVASHDTTRFPVKGADHIFGVLSGNKVPSQLVITTTAGWFGKKLR